MNLRSFDLNLLLVFDAIDAERSISKAALRLHLSQPTVSNALARLREHFADPLFERSGHGMAPTPRAKALAEPIRHALALLEGGLSADGSHDFDFARTEREFVVAVEDYGETVVLPRFIDWLGRAAPGTRIRIRPEPGSALQAELRDGAVDLALDYFPIQRSDFHHTCVMTENLLTLARRDHPLVGDRLSLELYLSLRHVVLAHRGHSRPMIDLALAKRDLARHIAVIVPHFLSMPVLVQSSDLVATLPRRMALLYADHFRLEAHAVPLRVPQFPVYLLWHANAEADPGHRWLREQLVQTCRRL